LSGSCPHARAAGSRSIGARRSSSTISTLYGSQEIRRKGKGQWAASPSRSSVDVRHSTRSCKTPRCKRRGRTALTPGNPLSARWKRPNSTNVSNGETTNSTVARLSCSEEECKRDQLAWDDADTGDRSSPVSPAPAIWRLAVPPFPRGQRSLSAWGTRATAVGPRVLAHRRPTPRGGRPARSVQAVDRPTAGRASVARGRWRRRGG